MARHLAPLALLLALAMPASLAAQAAAQAWDPTGMPPSPQMGDPVENTPDHRYDPAFPSRGLDVPGEGVPLYDLTPDTGGRFFDRETIDALALDRPEQPLAGDPSWISGMPYVVDGDSLGLNGRLVRLAGIDAPEIDQLCYAGGMAHRCGSDSRAWLAHAIEDTPIDCKIHHLDAAQRLVATCWSAGREVGAWSISQGRSFVWAGAPSPYGELEAEARAARLGVWAFDTRHPADWRSLTQDARLRADHGMAQGTLGASPPFPYLPFTARDGRAHPAPEFSAPSWTPTP